MTPLPEPHGSPQPAITPDAALAPIIMHASVYGHAQAVIVTQSANGAAARRAIIVPVARQRRGKASIS